MHCNYRAWFVVLLLLCGGVALVAEGDYRLAAQDKLTVTVLRHPELSGAFTVPPDGFIDFPRIGRVMVTGKTTMELETVLRERLGAFMRDPEVSVTVAEARPRQAYVLGAVARPGQYALGAGARVTELLAAAGDLVGDRAMLTASLVRGKTILPITLQAALGGDAAANLPLQEGDVLWVQEPKRVTVVVFGQVRTPGVLKLREGSTVQDALAQAGDLTGERAELTASVARGAATFPVNLTALLTGADPAANLRLQEGDVLWVQPLARITVVVSGQVKTPGLYKMHEGSMVLDALAQAGDAVGERSLLTASIARGDVTLPVNLQGALSGADAKANLPLRDGDILWVQERTKITVVVTGQVKNPGAVKLQENSSLVDALAATGDLNDRPERMRIALVHGTTTTPLTWGDSTHKLHDGDMILVEREPAARIFVNGHVKNPGAYELADGGGVLEAVALAGGVLDRPALDQVTIVRASTGAIERVNLAPALTEGKVEQNPHLSPGDQVIIPVSTSMIVVLGKVRQPGTFPINEHKPLTVVDAISLAGGPDRRAMMNKVVIIRVIDGNTQRIPVDVTKILQKGKNEKNLTLVARDIVYVPEVGSLDWGPIIENISRLGFLATIL